MTRTTFPSTLTETYTYDVVGNLLSKTDRKGQAINYFYDTLDRLVTKSYPDSTAVNYTYDNVSRLTRWRTRPAPTASATTTWGG